MVAYGSGLSAQLMVAAETTVGTAVTTTTGYEFLSENFKFAPTDLDGSGLKAGQAFERVARHTRSRIDVNGDFTVEHADKGHMALLWRHALGSSLTVPVVIGATTAFESYLTPGTRAGLGLTVQVGEVQPDTTVRPFTWSGVKIPQWDFSVSDGQVAQLKLTCDAWNLDTAAGLATAAYTAGAGIFTFMDASTFKIGGTPSTSAGKTTVAGGSAMTTLFNSLSLTGTTGLKQDRYGLGNAGVKREQLENAIPTITGQLGGEFTQRTEIFDLFKSNTQTTLQLDLTHFDGAGKDAGGVNAGPNPYLLSFIFPAIKFTDVSANTGGPDVTQQTATFKAFDDGSGTNPVMQVHLVSSDTTL
jgi:hypothetical protein